jgi:hypothetical protein
MACYSHPLTHSRTTLSRQSQPLVTDPRPFPRCNFHGPSGLLSTMRSCFFMASQRDHLQSLSYGPKPHRSLDKLTCPIEVSLYFCSFILRLLFSPLLARHNLYESGSSTGHPCAQQPAELKDPDSSSVSVPASPLPASSLPPPSLQCMVQPSSSVGPSTASRRSIRQLPQTTVTCSASHSRSGTWTSPRPLSFRSTVWTCKRCATDDLIWDG